MKVINFLRIFESNPFLLYYYGFSVFLSVSIGKLFMRFIDHKKVWFYFFTALIHVVSFFGIFSFLVFLYETFSSRFTMNPLEILIPFFVMAVVLIALRGKVNPVSATGFRTFVHYLALLCLLMLFLFFLDRMNWVKIANWPLSWVFVILLASLWGIQRGAKRLGLNII